LATPVYGQAFLWRWRLPSGETHIVLQDAAFPNPTDTMSLPFSYISDYSTSSSLSASWKLKQALDLSHDALFGGGTGDYEVEVLGDGRFLIINSSIQDTVLLLTDAGTTIPNGSFGLKANTSGAVDVPLPGVVTTGPGHTTTYQANGIFLPYVDKERDTGEEVAHLTETMSTLTGRPVNLNNSEDYIRRTIRYLNVAATRMKQYRADDQNYSDSAGTEIGDPNICILNMIDSVLVDNTSGVTANNLYISEDITVSIDANGRSDLHQIDLETSEISLGIKDHILYEDSSLETYTVTLNFRKDS